MGWIARQVIEHLDRGEVEVEWWMRYELRLTPAELKRIRRDDYSAIVRPLQPGFTAGWLEIGPRLSVRIDEPEIRRGKWRARIVHVRDFRAPASCSPPGKRTRESLEGVTTLAGAEGSVGEPERMEPPDNSQRVRLRRAMSVRAAIIGE